MLEVSSKLEPYKTLSVPIKISLKHDVTSINSSSNIKKIRFSGFVTMIFLIVLLSIVNVFLVFFFVASKRKTASNNSGMLFYLLVKKFENKR